MVFLVYEESRFEYEDMNETCPKTSAAYENQVLEFHSYVINLRES